MDEFDQEIINILQNAKDISNRWRKSKHFLTTSQVYSAWFSKNRVAGVYWSQTDENKIRSRLNKLKKQGYVGHIPRLKGYQFFWYYSKSEKGKELKERFNVIELRLEIIEDLLMERCGVDKGNLKSFVEVHNKASENVEFRFSLTDEQILQIATK